MKKILIYFVLSFGLFSFAQEIHFKEIKYIFALDSEFRKQGSLNINEQKIKLHYNGDAKTILYEPTSISIITSDTKEQYTHEEQKEYSLFFSLVLGIFNNDTEKLKENFTIQTIKDEQQLIPNEYLSAVIEKITYKKTNNKLQYLQILFTNQDKIKITQLD